MKAEESRVMFLPLEDIPDKSIAELKNSPNIIAYELCGGLGSCGWIIYIIRDKEEWPSAVKIPECLKDFMNPAAAGDFEVFCLDNIEEPTVKRDGKMLTLSTGHISVFTARSFEKGQIPHVFPIYKKGEYGWFIYLHNLPRISSLSLPSDLGLVIQFAVDREVDFLCLDSDGDRVNELPFYEW